MNREQVAGLRYLVVEDQGFQRWVIGNLLETLGAAKVFSAGDGMAALEILRSIDPPIDVVLTDRTCREWMASNSSAISARGRGPYR